MPDVPVPQEISPGVHCVVIGKGLAASNVYLVRSGSAWALIDTSWRSGADAIRQVAETVFGPGARPVAILLTHIHPDHSGAAGLLARSWNVPVYVGSAELPMAAGRYLPQYSMPLDRWIVVPLLRVLRVRVAADDIRDVTRGLPEGAVPGLPDWEYVATPGHTPGHVAYLRRGDGVLVSGDAVLTVDLNSLTGAVTGRQRLAGPPRYTTWDGPTAQRCIAALAQLQPRVLAPGHGRPLTAGAAEALHALAHPRRPGPDRTRTERRGLRGLLRPLSFTGEGTCRPPPRLYSRLQWLGFALTSVGLSPSYVVTLEVPGRRTGVIRRTNLVQVEHQGRRYLVSLTGESEWVRNVRAAQGAVVLGRRVRHAATLLEVAVPERAPVLRAYLLRAGRRPGSAKVRREADMFFGISTDPSLDALGALAARYPVFRVLPTPGSGAR